MSGVGPGDIQPADHPFMRRGGIHADQAASGTCRHCGRPEGDHPRPLIHDDAEAAYREDLDAARKRYAELSYRDLCATAAARLHESGEFDPDRLGHQAVAAAEPLSAADRLEHMAIGEVLARWYRHPAMLDDAARAGASWD